MNEPGLNLPPDAGSDRPAHDNAVPTTGKQLALLREERGWTIEQVAAQLNFAPRQVVAIEKDDFAALPGTAVTRGFIRAYAKLLKVDAAPLLAMLPGEKKPVETAVTSRKILASRVPQTRFPSMGSRSSGSPGKKMGAVALVIVLAGVVWFSYQAGALPFLSDALPPKAEDRPASLPGMVMELPKPGARAMNSEAQSNSTQSNMPPESAVNVTRAPVVPPLNSAAQAGQAAMAGSTTMGAIPGTPATSGAAAGLPAPAAAVAPPPAPSATRPAESDAAGKKGALVLTLRSDSWIEIKRPDNTVVVAKVGKAGTTESFDITGPVILVLGNASGVDATLRGNPVDLKASKANNVARLKLN